MRPSRAKENQRLMREAGNEAIGPCIGIGSTRNGASLPPLLNSDNLDMPDKLDGHFRQSKVVSHIPVTVGSKLRPRGSQNIALPSTGAIIDPMSSKESSENEIGASFSVRLGSAQECLVEITGRGNVDGLTDPAVDTMRCPSIMQTRSGQLTQPKNPAGPPLRRGSVEVDEELASVKASLFPSEGEIVTIPTGENSHGVMYSYAVEPSAVGICGNFSTPQAIPAGQSRSRLQKLNAVAHHAVVIPCPVNASSGETSEGHRHSSSMDTAIKPVEGYAKHSILCAPQHVQSEDIPNNSMAAAEAILRAPNVKKQSLESLSGGAAGLTEEPKKAIRNTFDGGHHPSGVNVVYSSPLDRAIDQESSNGKGSSSSGIKGSSVRAQSGPVASNVMGAGTAGASLRRTLVGVVKQSHPNPSLPVLPSGETDCTQCSEGNKVASSGVVSRDGEVIDSYNVIINDEQRALSNDRIVQQRLQEAKALSRRDDGGSVMHKFSLWNRMTPKKESSKNHVEVEVDVGGEAVQKSGKESILRDRSLSPVPPPLAGAVAIPSTAPAVMKAAESLNMPSSSSSSSPPLEASFPVQTVSQCVGRSVADFPKASLSQQISVSAGNTPAKLSDTRSSGGPASDSAKTKLTKQQRNSRVRGPLVAREAQHGAINGSNGGSRTLRLLQKAQKVSSPVLVRPSRPAASECENLPLSTPTPTSASGGAPMRGSVYGEAVVADVMTRLRSRRGQRNTHDKRNEIRRSGGSGNNVAGSQEQESLNLSTQDAKGDDKNIDDSGTTDNRVRDGTHHDEYNGNHEMVIDEYVDDYYDEYEEGNEEQVTVIDDDAGEEGYGNEYYEDSDNVEKENHAIDDQMNTLSNTRSGKVGRAGYLRTMVDEAKRLGTSVNASSDDMPSLLLQQQQQQHHQKVCDDAEDSIISEDPALQVIGKKLRTPFGSEYYCCMNAQAKRLDGSRKLIKTVSSEDLEEVMTHVDTVSGVNVCSSPAEYSMDEYDDWNDNFESDADCSVQEEEYETVGHDDYSKRPSVGSDGTAGRGSGKEGRDLEVQVRLPSRLALRSSTLTTVELSAALAATTIADASQKNVDSALSVSGGSYLVGDVSKSTPSRFNLRHSLVPADVALDPAASTSVLATAIPIDALGRSQRSNRVPPRGVGNVHNSIDVSCAVSTDNSSAPSPTLNKATTSAVRRGPSGSFSTSTSTNTSPMSTSPILPRGKGLLKRRSRHGVKDAAVGVASVTGISPLITPAEMNNTATTASRRGKDVKVSDDCEGGSTAQPTGRSGREHNRSDGRLIGQRSRTGRYQPLAFQATANEMSPAPLSEAMPVHGSHSGHKEQSSMAVVSSTDVTPQGTVVLHDFCSLTPMATSEAIYDEAPVLFATHGMMSESPAAVQGVLRVRGPGSTPALSYNGDGDCGDQDDRVQGNTAERASSPALSEISQDEEMIDVEKDRKFPAVSKADIAVISQLTHLTSSRPTGAVRGASSAAKGKGQGHVSDKESRFTVMSGNATGSGGTNRTDTEVYIAESRDGSTVRFRKGELIGEGSFGRVYKSFNTLTGELMAAKQVVLADGTEAEVETIKKEIKVMLDLHHDNIVRYIGTQQTDRFLFILLEYVPGGSIHHMLANFGAFSESVVRRYTSQILAGVDYLHNRGIVHRDIKGANVLVTDSGIAKLADFGCSKQLAGLCTASLEESLRLIKGSVPWMAPEVIKQTGSGRSADIWSVGATVIEMSTGKPPWPNYSNDLAGLFHVATSKFPPPVPRQLSSVCANFLRRCLVIDAKDRATAQELVVDYFFNVDHERALAEHGGCIPRELTEQEIAAEAMGAHCVTPSRPKPAVIHPSVETEQHVVAGNGVNALRQRKHE